MGCRRCRAPTLRRLLGQFAEGWCDPRRGLLHHIPLGGAAVDGQGLFQPRDTINGSPQPYLSSAIMAGALIDFAAPTPGVSGDTVPHSRSAAAPLVDLRLQGGPR